MLLSWVQLQSLFSKCGNEHAWREPSAGDTGNGMRISAVDSILHLLQLQLQALSNCEAAISPHTPHLSPRGCVSPLPSALKYSLLPVPVILRIHLLQSPSLTEGNTLPRGGCICQREQRNVRLQVKEGRCATRFLKMQSRLQLKAAQTQLDHQVNAKLETDGYCAVKYNTTGNQEEAVTGKGSW